MTMLKTQELVREFGHHLPEELRRSVNPTTTMSVAIYKAVNTQGWTTKQLADECSRDLATAVRPAPVITSRLKWCAEHPPARPVVKGFTQPIPWCGNCTEIGRWIEAPPEQGGAKIGHCSCWTDPNAQPEEGNP